MDGDTWAVKFAAAIQSKLDDKTRIVGFEMPKLESDLSYTRIDEKTGKTVEVFFNNEDAQKADRNENLPPSIRNITFNPKEPNHKTT